MGRRLEADFDATPEAVSAARRFVAAALAAWELDDLAEVAQICTSEAASNAVRHAGTAFRLQVQEDGTDLTVRVVDGGPGCPVIKEIDPEAESGRGIQLISTLATRWGWERADPGKVVWFALALVGPAPR